MNRSELQRVLTEYTSSYAEEQGLIPRFLDILKYENCFSRDLEIGHITASAWIINESATEVLLMHHVKLDKWLQPGGHADGDEDVLNVASKEMTEETGLISYELAKTGVFDLDIHSIPERKGVPQHDHYDVRFNFIAKNPEEATKNEESNDIKWIPIQEVSKLVNHERSIVRMVDKTLKLNSV